VFVSAFLFVFWFFSLRLLCTHKPPQGNADCPPRAPSLPVPRNAPFFHHATAMLANFLAGPCIRR
jgi:hypothetical protein